MASSVLTSLSLAFLAAGVTLLLTSQALARRARRYQLGMQALLQLSTSDMETLDLPRAAWPTLQAAGWCSLQWSGDWYGQKVRGQWGDLTRSPSEPGGQVWEVHGGQDASLTIGLVHSMPRGEQHLFANHLAQVFVMLLETRLRERTGALSAALAERGRLSLYLQHDMRNLAQWVTWVSTDFVQASTPQALLQVAQRLQANAPLALERAQRLTAALGKAKQHDVAQSMSLRSALEQAARLSGIEIDMEGDAKAWVAPDSLERALDNLLSNLASDWRNGAVQAPRAVFAQVPPTAEQTAQASLSLTFPIPAHGLSVPPEKLFEPFASGRPGGLGLGLYQARKCLQDSGGDLSATVVSQTLRFELRLPQECD